MTWRSQYGRRIAVVLGCACAIAGGLGCSRDSATRVVTRSGAEAGSGIRIVAVERVYGDLARQIGGSAVAVDTILNSPSADPHAYEPATGDADAIAGAGIVIENGLGYDAFADKLLAASPAAGRVVFTVGTLGGHHVGDNPHVWYEVESLRRFVDALTGELVKRDPKDRGAFELHRRVITGWLTTFSATVRAIGKNHASARVAITEPVFDYVLEGAHLAIVTPPSFSHAIEEGNDPAPQDVDTMRALLSSKNVGAFVYNRQTVEPSTERLLDVAKSAGVPIVPVTETLPAGMTTQAWIDGEVTALDRAL